MGSTLEAIAILRSEAGAVETWAVRRGWNVLIDYDALSLLAVTSHPLQPDLKITFKADVSKYRANPPTWTCLDGAGQSTRTAYPAGGSIPNGPQSSIFHPGAFLCAPWSALAYKENAGPHSDWGPLFNWLNAPPPSSQAHTLADMLATIALHLEGSPGMLL